MVSAHVERAHLDDGLHTWGVSTWHRLRSTLTHIALSGITEVEFLVDTGHNQIENGNDISGVVFELSVESLVMIKDVLAVNIENVLLSVVYLSKLLDIKWLFSVILSILRTHISSEEIAETVLNIRGVDIRTIQDLSVR
jgi:hypothetical protein